MIRCLILCPLLLLAACATPQPDPQAGWAALQSGDYATALAIWQPLADAGDPTAQTNLGTLYSKGNGVPQDNAQAVDWFRRAAEQGFAPAQYNLGLMYAHGRGVPEDKLNAYAWLALAAVQDHPTAAATLESYAQQLNAGELAQAQALGREYQQRYQPTTP